MGIILMINIFNAYVQDTMLHIFFALFQLILKTSL